ncbi:hypothetical protein AUK57_00780 [Candidatus Saccharibacteria bacterium CG2_30_41_52]|nr:MAG: hypothetical protein AUK57_00780 [Candidatus Saccharibacteria bacterium CG2_30_41_52]
MDKKLLKEFAMKSRESLTSLVRAELNAMHIAETINWTQSGELYQTIVDGRNIVLTIDEKLRYDKLQAAVKIEGIKLVAEKAAYTWFNRIVAIRYMELNKILPQSKHNEWLGVRVLSDDSNHPDPDILKASNLRRTDLDLQLDVDKVLKLARDEEKFRMVLLAVVKKLGSIMPDVFNGDTNSIDFLLPKNLLGAGGFVSEVLKLPVALFDRVEVIGWLYQYYNQAEKDIAMKKKSAVEKDEIPYVTQIFTPDWIVKYMVENSLGRYWLEHGGDEHLATNWKYLIKSGMPTANVVKKMPNIEDVTFIDPCAGSGHILVYAFEVFYQIYLSLGYAPAQIPEKILTHNLYGLDIDDRAKQLSILSALLVARSYDKGIFTKHIRLNITSIAESNGMSGLPGLLKGESRDIAQYLVETFHDAKEYGSILKVKSDTYAKLRNQLDDLSPLDRNLYADRAEQLIHQAEILSHKYTIAVTNPPYMNKYDAKLKTYVNTYYSESKADLYSVFMEVCLNLAIDDGYVSMVTMQSWMFLTGQEKLRNMLQSNCSMVNMIHLGPGAFLEMVGDVLQTTAFTLRKGTTNLIGDYIRVTDIRDSDKKEKLSLEAITDENHELRFRAGNADFEVFPGRIIAYWASDAIKKAFINGIKVGEIAPPQKGAVISGKDLFMRLWWEVDSVNTNLQAADRHEAIKSGSKWFPYDKASGFRKWYGNNDYFTDWQNDGVRYKQYVLKQYPYLKTPGFVVQNEENYFIPHISYGALSSGILSVRYKPRGVIHSGIGPGLFAAEDELSYLQGALNSHSIQKIAAIISPTLNFQTGEVASYPVIKSTQYRDEVIRLVEECRELSKSDWDSFETSWDFERHPLLPTSGETKLADTYDTWDKLSKSRWNKLKANEERLNEIFIEVYGMQDELTKTVEDKYVSVRKADITREAKSLLSYFVGVIFGRYSLNKPVINFAGGDWTTADRSSLVDDDNIVPIMDGEFYTDDIVKKIRDFLMTVYGESTLHVNLDWLADAIGRRSDEKAEDAIRRYFVNDFFTDHFREYGKRPIYWLLTSGKDNGFKALFYLHRYQPNLIATVRTQYLLNTQNVYTKRLAELDSKTVLNNDDLRLKVDLTTKLAEIKKYDALIAVAASKNVKLDLDVGVKVNYPKLSQCAADVKPGSEILEMKGVKL